MTGSGKSRNPGGTPGVSIKKETTSGIPIPEVCDSRHLRADLESALGTPGQFPYTRGVHANMYRGRLWTMRQYAGFGSATDTNKRFRYLIQQGTTGLSVAFDLPTQMGYDPDHELARGEVGRVGVSICCIEDLDILFSEIPLDKVSISMTINSTAGILLAMLLVVAERRGVAWAKLNGTVQNDILKEYVARGTYIYPPQAGLKLAVDICEFATAHVPQWNTLSISGYHIREAGSTAAEELALTFSNAISYVESALERGLKIDQFAPRLAFFFNCHNNFFEEIAKFRAARRIWARIMRDRFAAKDPHSCTLRFHTQTAGSTLTAQQPLNNVVRTTLQALAAVCGGTQSLHTNSYDEALGLPSQESAKLALRTQQIIAYESGVADSVDPLGGSFLVEYLTDQIENLVVKKIEEIDQRGGMLKCIEEGIPQRMIEQSAYRAQMAIESEQQKVVGVNCFSEAQDSGDVEPQQLSLEVEREQRDRLKRLKACRAERKVTKALTALSERAVAGAKLARIGGDNLMPLIIDALRADATLGEISQVLRGVYGEHDRR